DGQRGAGVWERGAPPDVDLVAHRPVVRADLPVERDFPTPERPTDSEASAPGAEEADQLPYAVHAEAARLYRVTEKVALEEPVVAVHVPLGHDAPACAIATDVDDPVDHEKRGKRQARAEARGRVFDQLAVREREQVRLGETRPPLELGVRHRHPSLALIDILRSRSRILSARAHGYPSLALVDILRSR